ncbi:MAG TPA: glutathione peroxidase [Bacteroidia bacterium]|jgi:glutathione peroxidase|nr:glutathione peroxidase [Bacteroidia bacterium]
MKIKLTLIGILLIAAFFSLLSFKAQMKTLYDFKAKTLEGADFNLASLKGKKVLVVNTASKCGFTPQYAQLEKLYKEYGGDKFTIIGFPANNFGHQEPGTNGEIKEFCTKNYGVTFPMMQKISVKGDDMDALYKWLTEKSENGVQDAPVMWNFQKFMIDENGHWVGVAMSQDTPKCEKIVNWIKGTSR